MWKKLGRKQIIYIFAVSTLQNFVVMKKFALSLISLLALSSAAWAQDDIYFVPSKKALQVEQQQSGQRYKNSSSYNNDSDYDYDNWADYRIGSRDVDEYNRQRKARTRKEMVDTIYNDDQQTMTGRIVRFRSPRGVIVSSPFYYDYYYDLAYYDPWFSDWGWSSWYGWYDPFYYGRSWNRWISPWGWSSWYSPWGFSVWHSPWYSGWNWGWGGWYSPYDHYGWGGYYRNYTYDVRPRGNTYYGVTGSNSRRGGAFDSRGGGFTSRSGNVSRGGSWSGRGNYNTSTTNSSYQYNDVPSRRGDIVNSSRRGGRPVENYSPSRSMNNTYSQPSRSGGFDMGGSRNGGFSSGNSGGGFSGGSSSRGGGVIGGRR